MQPRFNAPRRFLIALPLLLLAAPAAVARPVFPPGSAIGLEPPPGFSVSPGSSGFENRASGGRILMLEAPPSAYGEFLLGLTPNLLGPQGLEEEARERVRVAGREGLLVRLRRSEPAPGATVWVLAFPAEDFAGRVEAVLPGPPLDPRTTTAVENALRGAALRRVEPAERRAALPFLFEEAPGLKLRSTTAGSAAVLAPPGASPGDPAVPVLTIASALGRSMVPEDRRAEAAELVLRATAHLRDLKIEEAGRGRTAAGLEAVVHRGEATEVRTGHPLRVQQWVIFFPDGATLRALAEAPPERFAAALPEFEQVVRSLRRR